MGAEFAQLGGSEHALLARASDALAPEALWQQDVQRLRAAKGSSAGEVR